MNKKRMISIIAGVFLCVLCAVIVRFNMNNNNGQHSSDTTVATEKTEEASAIGDDSDKNSTFSKTEEDAYWENLQEIEKKDKENEEKEGNRVEPYETFEVGGIKYTFKDVRCIKDVASIPEIIPGYDEKYRQDTGIDGPYMKTPMADREKENRLLMLCYVFEVENTGKLGVEYSPLGAVSLRVTDEDGYVVGGAGEIFYINGDEKMLNTKYASLISLMPGESRELVLAIYDDTTDFWEGQDRQPISWDDQLVFHICVTRMGRAVDDNVNTIQDEKGIRYFEIFRGSLNEFSTFSKE